MENKYPMQPGSDAILDPVSGKILVYSELLKGNAVIMEKGYPMQPRSGLMRTEDGKLVNIVNLLLLNGLIRRYGVNKTNQMLEEFKKQKGE